MDESEILRISFEKKTGLAIEIYNFKKEEYLEGAKQILSDLALNKNVIEAVINSFFFTELYFNKNDLPYILKYPDTRWYYNEINYFMLANIQEFSKEDLMKYSESIPDIIITPEYIQKRFAILEHSKDLSL
jgi:hypothetical protein